ncbi:MAG: hypothetical protein A3C69_01520 [Candidatus Yanofskybacteria bacterium RIFCSPHIGHO2_02_FULL_43_12]|uniref:YggT family protein n=1 Tax=Candidatus Yanofskybacteria bacterium RIFCSPLOWO2_01_FULL_49_25 TaxID=1802701 RepID=A0A1F8GTG7_9BACT|nr:MAG: hypothetical protein A3C69_01520 [Candidatus Yanofskybacteria bacterium RIFCSPHIGHO2_02_FULL_43_12]OGN27936.1 MAG: hypothetical protein A3A33_04220 [Candidatus Yanofskybacteria bacterium RIFCSPLOWO2_01_FULL_49_25]
MKHLIRLINIIFGLMEALLAIRLVLKLLSASPNAPFVAWIYQASQFVLQPFFGAFPSVPVSATAVFEITTLFAIIIYAIVRFLIVEICLHFEASLSKHGQATHTDRT